MNKKYLLLDGNNLAHIAYHRGKSIVIKKKKAFAEAEKIILPEGIIDQTDYSLIESVMYHVFFLKLHKHFKKFKGYQFIVCWDNPGSHAWRREIYPEYKVRRVYDQDPIWRVLFNGIAKLQNILSAYPIAQVIIKELEADDIIYAYSSVLKNYGEVTIISGDSDLQQSVQDFGVKLYHPITDKYIKVPTTYDCCLAKAIRGDNTDDIPGVYGYGPVKSTALAEACAKDPTAINKLSKEQQDIVNRNLRLIQIKNNPNLQRAKLEVANVLDIDNHFKIDTQKIKKFYFDNKLKALLEDFDSVVSIFSDESEE